MNLRQTRSFASQRQQLLLELVNRDGAVRVAELATELDVSQMTVRRDLEHLDNMGLVTRVHGGATVRRELSSSEPGVEVKTYQNIAEKSAIAEACADLITSGTAIGLTGGTTTVQVARALTRIPNLTIVTNSLGVADVFYASDGRDVHVVLTGGVRTPSDALVGSVAVDTLRSFHLDVVIMGVHGMQESTGFTTPNLHEAETNKTFISSAQRLIVVADHSKWGMAGLTTIAPLAGADVMITDAGLDPAAQAALAQHVGQLIVTQPEARTSGASE